MREAQSRCGAIALVAMVLAISWQWALVHAAFSGNWNGLFCAGEHVNRPPEIQDREYVFRGIDGYAGYDGQYYQLVAHDPLFARHYDRFIDTPRVRYRRILMPGLAYLLAAGQPMSIDWAYFAVCWFFLALGTYCLARVAVDEGRSPLWGFLFLVTPATLSAIERMTVDISLTALLAASLLAARRQRWLLLWLSLAGAMLAKETGVLAIIAVAIWLARQQKFRLAAALSSSLLPAVAWYGYVQSQTSVDYPTSGFNFGSAFFACMTPQLDAGIVALLVRVATVAAVIAILWAAIRSIALAVRDRFHDLALLLCFVFAALALLLPDRAIWVEANAFTRVYSTLLVCLIAATFRRGFTQTLISFAMAACPLGIQLSVHLAGPLWRLATQR
jgi:hypothetical protein